MIVKNTCISIFSKIAFVDQSKPCAQIYLHNMASCINLQLPIGILKTILIILDMHHHKTYMYINFQHNWVKTQVVTVLTSLFAKNRKLHTFATINNISDMHHRRTYMHINFQHNRVSRSVNPVRTNTFAKKLQVA